MILTQRSIAWALRGGEAVRDPHDARNIGDQVALGLGRRAGQQDNEVVRKGSCVLAAFDDVDPPLGKFALLTRREGGFVLDGVRDPAEQIGIADRVAERGGQLGNGKRECAGNALQDLRLVSEVAFKGGFASCRFQLRHPAFSRTPPQKAAGSMVSDRTVQVKQRFARCRTAKGGGGLPGEPLAGCHGMSCFVMRAGKRLCDMSWDVTSVRLIWMTFEKRFLRSGCYG